LEFRQGQVKATAVKVCKRISSAYLRKSQRRTKKGFGLRQINSTRNKHTRNQKKALTSQKGEYERTITIIEDMSNW